MSPIFDAIPPTYSDIILCYYQNATTKLEIIRISNIPGWYFEHILFPGERLLFEAVTEAKLEIYRGDRVKPNLAQVVPCINLATKENQIAEPHLVLGCG
ncbi:MULTISPECIES: DUF1830 domain-containing protein [Limnospira]|uniref:DUF1830 domain-containing protein n=1 Tax=Limnospira indica PCC 8005 TaxID=376219 RepID=A0A9P1KI88_9CYAN|nr:DUF1830 domain-containing protein [Limnospira indica]RAQ39326.1 DUF1830 domain-containing protein [Arthrospira sp. O9.13F]CDM95980.1 conserved hypothetical protein [Limnospira indica PCC 8005]